VISDDRASGDREHVAVLTEMISHQTGS